MHWTSLSVELSLELTRKQCTQCKEFKSSNLFFKKGDRLESQCKECKKSARTKRSANLFSEDQSVRDFAPSEPESAELGSRINNPKTYEDLGLTKSEFLEVVEFFQELIRLDKKGR